MLRNPSDSPLPPRCLHTYPRVASPPPQLQDPGRVAQEPLSVPACNTPASPSPWGLYGGALEVPFTFFLLLSLLVCTFKLHEGKGLCLVTCHAFNTTQ